MTWFERSTPSSVMIVRGPCDTPSSETDETSAENERCASTTSSRDAVRFSCVTALKQPWSSGGRRICSTSSGSSPHPAAPADQQGEGGERSRARCVVGDSAQRQAPARRRRSVTVALAASAMPVATRTAAHGPDDPGRPARARRGGGRVDAADERRRPRPRASERRRARPSRSSMRPSDRGDVADREASSRSRSPLQRSDQQALRLRAPGQRDHPVDRRRTVKVERRVESRSARPPPEPSPPSAR